MTIHSDDKVFQVMLGARLHDLRQSAGKFQPEAAKATGCHFSAISRYELGQAPIPPATLARLAKLYGCTVADFFQGLKIR